MLRSHIESRPYLNKLDRKVNIDIVPINNDFKYGLTIISSLHHETIEDILRYKETLIKEFGGTPEVQIIFADNTPGGRYAEALETIRQELTDQGFSYEHVHAEKSGKIHGLNKCLEKTKGEYVMSVDLNKKPNDGSLRGLYEKIKDGKHDLISAKLADNKKQTWCIGAAYIGKRWCFPGFPPVLSDDGYTERITRIRGGSISVANDLQIFDIKAENMTPDQKKKRAARWFINHLQLDHLTIVDDHKELSLTTHENISLLHRLYYLLVKENVKFSTRLLNKIKKIISELKIRKEVINYMNELLSNPELCSWND